MSRHGLAWGRDAVVSQRSRLPENRGALVGELVGELLASGREASFRVLGWSMHPTIKDGERVTLRGLGPEGARPGDIIAFRRNQQLVLHRVLETRIAEYGDLSYLTAGDGLERDDGVQDERAVLGKVIRVHGAEGDWSPDRARPWLSGQLRVLLGLHPRLRSAARAAKRILRRERGGRPSLTEG